MKPFLILLLWAMPFLSYSMTFQVGSSHTYANPNALYLANVLQDGDVIEIDAETYSGTDALAVWSQNDLIIRGIGDRPHLIADGQYIFGKGIWVLAGNNITVENIEFSGAVVPDKNGAGIRLDGIGLTVRHCFFHDNENGILTSNPEAGEILIEYSEFANNGHGDGFSHNLYIGRVAKLTFQFNYTHHAKIGHNLKSRADENYILYNRIMDEETGNSSRLIDLSNGGFSIVMGNLLMQGNEAENKNLVGYGLEGLDETNENEFYFVNNTLVNKRTASCLFLDINGQSNASLIANNVFTGTGEVHNNSQTELRNNLMVPDIAQLKFIDEFNYDYSLQNDSPAIDRGTDLEVINGNILIPQAYYIHPTDEEIRITFNQIDIGAYEFEPLVSTKNVKEPHLVIYPNPFTSNVNLSIKGEEIKQMDLLDGIGKIVHSERNINSLDISDLPSGIYFLKVLLKDSNVVVKKLVKK